MSIKIGDLLLENSRYNIKRVCVGINAKSRWQIVLYNLKNSELECYTNTEVDYYFRIMNDGERQ